MTCFRVARQPRMRESTVLVVLLLVTVEMVTGSKEQIVCHYGLLPRRRDVTAVVPVHCRTEPEPDSGDCNMQQCHCFLDYSGQQSCKHYNIVQQYSPQWGCGLYARCLSAPHQKPDKFGSRHRVHHHSHS